MTTSTTKAPPPKAKSDPKPKFQYHTIEEALIAFHKTKPTAVKSGSNPHFRSKYATLEEVIATAETASEFGLTFTQLIDFEIVEQGVIEFVKTIVMHESGDKITARTLIKAKDQSNPQQMGSGITYAKRYGLQSAFGIPSEDDDANSAATGEVVSYGQQASNDKGGW
nr:hypothetical protein [uncultured Mediterranean phage uvMED]